MALSIAAQPLGAALGELSQAAGVPIAFAPALVAGRRAPAVQGRLTLHQALDRLLAGSGLAATPDREGRMSIVTAHSALRDRATLDEVQVTAQAERGRVTQGSGSYQAVDSDAVTRLALSARETPQTLTVVTRQQMDDFALVTVDDALRSISGVVVQNQGNNGNLYFSRGFRMQAQYDGVPNPMGIGNANRSPPVDSAFLDRVEVLQGASGLLSGAGDPGGTINLVRKRPTPGLQASVEAQLGSWNRRRAVMDVSVPLSASVRARMVALADDGDSYLDLAYLNRRGFYGVLQADLAPTTQLIASVTYQKDAFRDHLGFPFASDGTDFRPPISRYYGRPDFQAQKKTTQYMMRLEQQLPRDWKLAAAYTRDRTATPTWNYALVSGDPVDAATGQGATLDQSLFYSREPASDAFDLFATGPFTLAGRRHEMSLGINGSRFVEATDGTFETLESPINILAFDPWALPPVPGSEWYERRSRTTQWGVYGATRLSLTDSLKLIAGARVSQFEARNDLSGRTTSRDNGVVSPYGGLVHDINRQHSVYVSYSDIFRPQSNPDADGNLLRPVVGANYEAGLKGELPGGRLQYSAALFRLTQRYLARRDESIPFSAANVCGGWCYAAAGKVVSQGLDLGVAGQIARAWNLAAGFSLVSSRYASGADDGRRYADNLPRRQFRLSAMYRVPGRPWSVGAQLRYQGRIDSLRANAWSRQGGFATVSLVTRYALGPRTELAVLIDNLFDKRYYTAINNPWLALYGEPRKLSLQLRHRL